MATMAEYTALRARQARTKAALRESEAQPVTVKRVASRSAQIVLRNGGSWLAGWTHTKSAGMMKAKSLTMLVGAVGQVAETFVKPDRIGSLLVAAPSGALTGAFALRANDAAQKNGGE